MYERFENPNEPPYCLGYHCSLCGTLGCDGWGCCEEDDEGCNDSGIPLVIEFDPDHVIENDCGLIAWAREHWKKI